MKKLVPILLLIVIFVIAANPPRPRNRSCEFLRTFHTPNLLIQCLFGSK